MHHPGDAVLNIFNHKTNSPDAEIIGVGDSPKPDQAERMFMRYDHVITGAFISRPNRFIAYCEIDGRTEKCHVKNTGRCNELFSGALSSIDVVGHGYIRSLSRI